MRHLTLAILCAATLSASIRASAADEFFSSDPVILKESQVAKFRGIINVVYLPLPDDLELGKSQSGYFLFTAAPYDVKLAGEDGQGEIVKNQQMFHLVLTEEQTTAINKLLQKPVEITAEPFGAHTRHHRSPVLLGVKSIRLLSAD